MRAGLIAVALVAFALLVLQGPQAPVASASTQVPITGDADCDLSVDELDALGVVQDLADVDTGLDCLDFADVNCDGVVDMADVIEILLYTAELPAADVPDDCLGVGATGLPPLVLAVDDSIDVEPDTIAGIDGGPDRPLAAIVDSDGMQSLFVADEVVVRTSDLGVLNAFIARWNGTLLSSIYPPNLPAMHLVKVELTGVDVSHLADDLRSLHEESWGQLDVSSDGALALLALAASEAANGLEVDLNWVGEDATLDNRDIADGSSGPTAAGVPWSPNPFDWPYMDRGSAQDIGVADAWRALGAAGKLDNKVKVAILDGGFVPNPDFPAGFDMNGPTGVPNPASCTAGSPCPWHGTSVTAAAMGVPGNGFGVAGPAGPIADAVLTQSPSLDVFSILRYVFLSLPATAIAAPDVLNISAGFSIPAEVCLTGICDAADEIMSGIRFLGVLVFAAAANDGTNVDEERCINLLLGEICYEKRVHVPCELDDVICVGGLAWDSTIRDPQSNWGTDDSNTVDIYGPMWQYTTPDPDNGIRWKNCGTSCASPFVAGVEALIEAANPGLSSDDVEHYLIDLAHHNADDPVVNRWVNAYGAVIAALGGNEPPELEIQLDSGDYAGGTAFPLYATATDAEDGVPAVQWTSSLDGPLGTGPLTPPVLLSYGTHIIAATATDSDGSTVTDTRTWNMVNYPPTVDLQSPLDGADVFEGQSMRLRGSSADQNRPSGMLDDDEVQWFTAPVGDPNNRTLVSTGHTLRTSFDEGVYLLTFKGTDDGGLSAEETITLNVGPPPLDYPPATDITGVDSSHACSSPYYYTLNGTADDPEDGTLSGASLSWYRSVNGGPQTFVGTGSSVQAPTSGLVNGDAVRFILKATDSANNTGEDFYDLPGGHFCGF